MRIFGIFTLLIFSLAFSVGATERGNWSFSDSILTVRNGVRSIPSFAFRDRLDIREVRFESSSTLTEIGEYAFLGCRNLRYITLPSSLQSLGEGAFRECESIEKIEIPEGVKKLPAFLFYWCEGLKDVKLPRGLTAIGRSSFGYCHSLEKISLPMGLKNIGSNAFSCCESLNEVIIPGSVTELESYAFSDCKNLKKITFPNNASLLGELILSGCYGLEAIEEMSPLPPKFDCDSSLFEPDEEERYAEVILKVGKGKVAAYRKAPGWGMFRKIEEIK